MISSPVPLKTRRVRERCMLNLSRAQTSYRCLDAEIVEVEIEVVSPSIVPSGNFAELKSYCHLYGAQGQRQAYL
ncbi:hypothetical protein TNCV_2573811 [Trichonephila clavipes]|nr:hypothetical protein TNCV_2573811 [Trichonephila clavipes]